MPYPVPASGKSREKSDMPLFSSPFDSIRHVDDQGEHWFARELGPAMGYRGKNSWRNVLVVLEKVKNMAVLVGAAPEELVVGVNNLQIRGNRGATQTISDFRLTRRACYMFAVCADERKVEVAAAKNYFVVETRRSEEIQHRTQFQNIGWKEVREIGKEIRKSFSGSIKRHGGTRETYPVCTNINNQHILGGTAKELKEMMGIGSRGSIRDNLDRHQLADLIFGESLGERRMDLDQAKTHEDCVQSVTHAALTVRKALETNRKSISIDNGGIR